MEHVISKDGTRIAYRQAGQGPPLVLVHGAMQDHTRWLEVAPMFEPHVSIYMMERRGRGESGDAASYAMEREYEDVAALVDSIGEPAHLLGHSYGAELALGAALLTNNVRSLVLYEPAILEGSTGTYEAEAVVSTIRLMEELFAAGKIEDGLTACLRGLLEMPDEQIELFKSSPAWKGRVASAPTILRELHAEAAYRFEPKRYANLTVRTLLLQGTESAQVAKDGTAALDAALPDSRIVVLEGQGHGAITTAPELFVREVLAFLQTR